jgi:hypothetical protein
MLIARTTAAAVLLMSCGACTAHRESAPTPSRSAAPSPAPSSSRASVDPSVSASPAAPTALPPGALVELVPSPADVPPGYDAAEGTTGPLGLTEVADLADDPEAAQRALGINGFKDGYSADYGNEQTGAFISVLVQRFTNEAGAKADYARQVSESVASSDPLSIAPVGDESSAFVEKVPEGDVAEIVSVRFRVRDLVWLVETGGQDSPDTTLARDIAARLAGKIA